MIELVIFDLDGVLIDSRDIHYDVLNKALEEINHRYKITRKEHLLKYDGNTTKEKLKMLSCDKQLPEEFYDKIWKRKQELTFIELENQVKENQSLIELFIKLKSDNIKIYICSNSIKKTVEIILNKLGLIDYIDGYYANEDVNSPKPHPEIYWLPMIKEGILPEHTLIVEDSYIGRKAALSSGAKLSPVKNTEEVTITKIYNDMKQSKTEKWVDRKLNVLIPMAGAGSRFADVGYTFPKPLIGVFGKPMIQLVTENLNIDANFIYIVRKEHCEKYNLKSMLSIIQPGCKIIEVDYLTQGACCTTLLAEEFIDNDNPLLIANSDQYIEWESGKFFHSVNTSSIDGAILTFKNNHPKWSYVKLDDNGNVKEVKEKEVISDIATIGIYYWGKGSDYVKYSHQMIDKDIRVNNEFYTAPVYNEAIEDGKIIKPYEIQDMNGIGIPEDLENFINKYNGKI